MGKTCLDAINVVHVLQVVHCHIRQHAILDPEALQQLHGLFHGQSTLPEVTLQKGVHVLVEASELPRPLGMADEVGEPVELKRLPEGSWRPLSHLKADLRYPQQFFPTARNFLR